MTRTTKIAVHTALLGTVSARQLARNSLRGAVGLDSLNFGSDACKCIGFQGVPGELLANYGNDSNPVYVAYPADVGSYCKAWEKGVKVVGCGEADPSKNAEFCGQPWCFVDACHCAGVKSPPKQTDIAPDALYKGTSLYYSYSTCGGEDTWPDTLDEHDCTTANSEEECHKLGDANCAWGKSLWGEVCLGLEAAGLCGDLPEKSVYGDHDCPCAGISAHNRSLTVHFEGEEDHYHLPGDFGARCQVWDEHDPICKKDPKAPGCGEPWCFVDAKDCRIDTKPAKSVFFPEATFQGHPLHFSYATCGGKDVPATKETQGEQTQGDKKTSEATPGDKNTSEEPHDAEQDEEREELQDLYDDANSHPSYDHDAYADEWHKEWGHHSQS